MRTSVANQESAWVFYLLGQQLILAQNNMLLLVIYKFAQVDWLTRELNDLGRQATWTLTVESENEK